MVNILRPLLALLLLLLAHPAQAAVTITFWSHEFGDHFPHSFITLRGTPDAGGAAVDANYGFTARTVSPAILWGSVASRMDTATPRYMDTSDAQFSLVLSDAKYAQVMVLVDAWRDNKLKYHLNKRNCVHFVKEAARIAGLSGLDRPKLMKKPRSYLLAVGEANRARVTIIGVRGADYLRTPVLPAPLPPASSGTISTTSSVAPNRG